VESGEIEAERKGERGIRRRKYGERRNGKRQWPACYECALSLSLSLSEHDSSPLRKSKIP
jgi:hypothetical protein